MKAVQKEISLNTTKRYDFIKITKQVEEFVMSSKMKNGTVNISSLHTTASLIIQENDETVLKDIIDLFERILPTKGKYNHSHENSENAIGHVVSTILGTDITIPLVNGKLKLGTWQDVFFVELDKARNRTISITIIGE